MLVCVVMNSGTWKGSSVLAQAISQYGELNVKCCSLPSLCLFGNKALASEHQVFLLNLSVFSLWYFIHFKCLKQSSKEVLAYVVLQIYAETSCRYEDDILFFLYLLTFFGSISFASKTLRTNLLYFLHLLLETSMAIYDCIRVLL